MAKQPTRMPPRRVIVLLVILALLSVVAVVRNVGRGVISSPRLGDRTLAYTPRELPVLEEDQRIAELGRGDSFLRNPFVFGAPPAPTRNLTPPPTRPPLAPRTPRATPTPHVIWNNGTPMPPPPPFDRTYIGFFGPKHLHVAAFKKDDKLEVAVEGDVLDDIFIVRKIGLESVEIGFVGYTEEENTRVPLADN